MQTEKQLQNYLKYEARKIGASFDKVESRSRRGFPDCLLILRGFVVLVEVKTPSGKGRLSPLQVRVIYDLRQHGASVAILETKEEVDNLLIFMQENADAIGA